jgi:dTDP-4-dehydrorhamnose reductase
MKVLITGANGQLGSELRRQAPEFVEVMAPDHAALDVGDERAVDALVQQFAPRVILNAAAYTAVDKAEAEPDQARRVNADGPALLARAAARLPDCRLIHVSTDYVFDGEASTPYLPGDATAPRGVYGETKLAGERGVLEALGSRALVVRTSWVYGPRGKNFPATMLRLMRSGDVRVVADQQGCPTSTVSLAEVIWEFALNAGSSGVFHWSDAGVTNWYDFAVAISEEARARGLLTEVHAVTPISTEEYPTPAKRPRFSALDSRATVAALGIPQLHWRVRLQEVLGELARG